MPGLGGPESIAVGPWTRASKGKLKPRIDDSFVLSAHELPMPRLSGPEIHSLRQLQPGSIPRQWVTSECIVDRGNSLLPTAE